MFDIDKDRLSCLVASRILEVWRKETGSLSTVLIEGTICITAPHNGGQNIVIQLADQFPGSIPDDDETVAENQRIDRRRHLVTEHPYEVLKGVTLLPSSSTMWSDFEKQSNSRSDLELGKDNNNNTPSDTQSTEDVILGQEEEEVFDGNNESKNKHEEVDMELKNVEILTNDVGQDKADNDSAIHDMSFGELVINLSSEEMSLSEIGTDDNNCESINSTSSGVLELVNSVSSSHGSGRVTSSGLSGCHVQQVTNTLSAVQRSSVSNTVSTVQRSAPRFQLVPAGVIRQFPYQRAASSQIDVFHRGGYSIALIERLRDKITRNIQNHALNDNDQFNVSLSSKGLVKQKYSPVVDSLLEDKANDEMVGLNVSANTKRCVSAPAVEPVKMETPSESDNALSSESSCEPQKVYSCKFCEKTFLFKSKYQEHLPVHTSVRPFQCSLCFRTYKYKYDLRVHVRTHLGIPTKSTVCPLCAAKFTSNKLLREHMKELHRQVQPVEILSESV